MGLRGWSRRMREVSLFVTFFSFFLPRDATQSAVMRLHVVRLYVHLSDRL